MDRQPLELEDDSNSSDAPIELKTRFPAENEWYHSSLLLLADIVGSGVLALTGAFSKMGWFFGFFLLILCCPLNMYTGILLARLRKHHPLVTTYGELGESLFGKNVGYVCYGVLYVYIFFVLGEYMVVMSRSIQGVVLQHGFVSASCGCHFMSHTSHFESGENVA